MRKKFKRKSKSLGRVLESDKTTSDKSLADIHKDLAHEEATSVHLWIGKDYVNWITRDLHDPHMPFNGKQQITRLVQNFIKILLTVGAWPAYLLFSLFTIRKYSSM